MFIDKTLVMFETRLEIKISLGAENMTWSFDTISFGFLI